MTSTPHDPQRDVRRDGTPPAPHGATPARPGEPRMLNPFQVLLLGGIVAAGGLLATQGIIHALPVTKASTSYRHVSEEVELELHRTQVALLQGGEAAGSDDVVVSVQPAGGTTRRLRAETRTEDGLVAALETAVSFVPAPRPEPRSPDDLPRLAEATVNRLLEGEELPVLRVNQDMRLVGESLDALVVVAPDAELVLEDVVRRGAVVSQAALSRDTLPAFDRRRAPRVRVVGSVRLDDHAALPGLSVVMPDGEFTSGNEPVLLQVQGDVVAHSLRLTGRGTLFGQLATLRPADLSTSVENPGTGRRPRRWAADLDMRGSHDPEFLAYVPGRTGWDDVQAMIDFEFPEDRR